MIGPSTRLIWMILGGIMKPKNTRRFANKVLGIILRSGPYGIVVGDSPKHREKLGKTMEF
ncbi:MAG: hypothetical protein OEZ21_05290 [Candidatus Bathyarchaeota archaeon]|nr:hypothetical protein [Candidatus Bathyarchaeota archaeon]MDH5746354.1 hypothetical protein [Candidatus Bathyarchaeota archaeon]